MIDKIEIDENIECVYELDNIGLPEHNLIKFIDKYYIENSINIFYFGSISDFMIEDKKALLVNDDGNILEFNKEQFDIIAELLKNF